MSKKIVSIAAICIAALLTVSFFVFLNGYKARRDYSEIRQLYEDSVRRMASDASHIYSDSTGLESSCFPWEDVEPCINNTSAETKDLATSYYLGGQSKKDTDTIAKCPECGRPKKRIFFRSPAWTWENLCGRAGWMSVCEHCRISDDFKVIAMS